MEDNQIDGVLYKGFWAENVKVTIEKIVNKFKFDKTKIRGLIKRSFLVKNFIFIFCLFILFIHLAVVCDEGSNLVRLFLQLFLDLDEPCQGLDSNLN